MKRMLISLAVTLPAVWFSSLLMAGQTANDTQRWDLRMIREAGIWKNLLVRYAYAEHKQYWPERKAALMTIMARYADSQWADDAALSLAGGRASFENDAAGAVAELKNLADRIPYGHTIVVSWDAEADCTYDPIWLMWQGGLVFLNPDGTTRIAKRFDRASAMPQPEKEAIAYFAHLEQYPRHTRGAAQLMISQILGQKGDEVGAIAQLEQLVASSSKYIAEASKADELAASQPDGYLIRCLWRPEYSGYLSLMGYYEKEKKTDKAIAKAQQLVAMVSPNGWHWEINRRIGDFYARNGLRNEANEQYRLALAAMRRRIEDDKVSRDTRIERIVTSTPSGAPAPSLLEKQAAALEQMIK